MSPRGKGAPHPPRRKPHPSFRHRNTREVSALKTRAASVLREAVLLLVVAWLVPVVIYLFALPVGGLITAGAAALKALIGVS